MGDVGRDDLQQVLAIPRCWLTFDRLLTESGHRADHNTADYGDVFQRFYRHRHVFFNKSWNLSNDYLINQTIFDLV